MDKNTETTKAQCKGCQWNGYSHRHINGEDGPRSECCKHTCRKSR